MHTVAEPEGVVKGLNFSINFNFSFYNGTIQHGFFINMGQMHFLKKR